LKLLENLCAIFCSFQRPCPEIPLQWVAPGLNAAIARPDLISHARLLSERIAARIKLCLAQARLSADDFELALVLP
jgi:hypothetical protein